MNMKLTVLGAIALTLAPTVAVADQPNNMVIVADDMGYGDLGCTGHPKIKTPHLDALADGNVRAGAARVEHGNFRLPA